MADYTDKRKQSLYFPEDMLREIEVEAQRQDARSPGSSSRPGRSPGPDGAHPRRERQPARRRRLSGATGAVELSGEERRGPLRKRPAAAVADRRGFRLVTTGNARRFPARRPSSGTVDAIDEPGFPLHAVAPVGRGLLLAAVAAFALLATAGCQRDDVRHYRVPRSPQRRARTWRDGGGGTAAPPAGGPVMDPSAVPAPPAGAGGVSWKLPKGWTETRAGGMRFATLVPATPGKLDVSVVVLPGPAGGENRQREPLAWPDRARPGGRGGTRPQPARRSAPRPARWRSSTSRATGP